MEIAVDHVFDEALVVKKAITTEIEYEGLMVLPHNVGLEMDALEQVVDLAGQYVDLDDYAEPVLENNFNYVFIPKLQ